jgi:hypothetical protein
MSESKAETPSPNPEETPNEPDLPIEAESEEPEWQSAFDQLGSSNLTDRQQAVEALASWAPAEADVLERLEQTAAQDRSQAVRQAALEILADPALHNVQYRRSRLSARARIDIGRELDRWEQQGLIKPELKAVLRLRYPLQPMAQAAKPSGPPAPPKERPSLTQILLSETTVQIVLYLGALFTLASAFIFATAIESIRMLILGGTTLAFFGAGILLFFRLKQAGFVMFLIAGVLILVDGGVLVDQFNLQNSQELPFWTGLLFVLGLVWLGGTALYRSRLFSIFWLWSWSMAAFAAGIWADQGIFAVLFLVAIASLIGLGGGLLLRRLESRLGVPLFVGASLQMLGLQSITLLGVLVLVVSDETIDPLEWAAFAGIWFVGALFYAMLTEWVTRHALTRLLAAISIALMPVWLLNTVNPDAVWSAVALVIWGIGLMIWGQLLSYLTIDRARAYSGHIFWNSLPIFFLGIFVGGQVAQGYAFGYLMLAGILMGVAAYVNRSTARFSASLVYLVFGYFSLFGFDVVQDLDLFPGLVLWLPAVGLISGGWLIRRSKLAERWAAPATVIGLILAAFSLFAGLTGAPNFTGESALLYLLWGLFILVYAAIAGPVWLAFGAWSTLSFSLILALVHFDIDRWMLLVSVWILLLYGAGLVLTLLAGRKPLPDQDDETAERTQSYWGLGFGWSSSLRLSGLALAPLAALTAPVQGDGIAVLGVGLFAIMFAIEGFRLRNIWYGFPANALLLGTWFLGLLFFDVDQPQYFSIAAAMLGLIMHYLLIREADNSDGLSLSSVVAFGTGILAVLVLLTTTYFQFVGEAMFRWFVLLFFQALAVLGYGLVVRSRSLVIAPLGFVILGVVSAVFVFAGELAILLLAGCGFLLLGIGVIALLARERLLKATEDVRERTGGWRG